MEKDLKKMYKTIMDDDFPEDLVIKFGNQTLIYRKKTWKIPDEKTGELIEKGLRYGENPDQQAAMYELINGNLVLGNCKFIEPGKGLVSSITEADMLQAGKHPGKINLTDVDNAINIIKFLPEEAAAVIVKHNNPCGVACRNNLADAFSEACNADRIAAFGGCVVVNRSMDKHTAEMISRSYFEVVVAPEFEEGTVDILTRKWKNLRIIRIDKINHLEKYCSTRFVDFKSLIDGGIIVQQSPINRIKSKNDFLPAKTVYKDKEYIIARQPTEKEYEDMRFGWNVEQGVTSNSVLFVKNKVTVGIGTGEQDRVGVAKIAASKAHEKRADFVCFSKYGISLDDYMRKSSVKERIELSQELMRDNAGTLLEGSIMVSDAFFPFRDGVDVGISEGVSAIVHPGGSEKDFESIEACNQADPQVTMVFTGQRAFRH